MLKNTGLSASDALVLAARNFLSIHLNITQPNLSQYNNEIKSLIQKCIEAKDAQISLAISLDQFEESFQEEIRAMCSQTNITVT